MIPRSNYDRRHHHRMVTSKPSVNRPRPCCTKTSTVNLPRRIRIYTWKTHARYSATTSRRRRIDDVDEETGRRRQQHNSPTTSTTTTTRTVVVVVDDDNESEDDAAYIRPSRLTTRSRTLSTRQINQGEVLVDQTKNIKNKKPIENRSGSPDLYNQPFKHPFK